ncbi:hypothetical protein AMAG_13997 [Allomyces macrogynus ATCC 38327]|uniref:Uncharacterized protein n=1 Tax=Allomyces macrogynus (strain ATCC 38327) TaxID=578462 RepID=A0A0L0T332_ALLM3|nr:hypothetical protein AMAG_13997 [Allomyces macrogynus ATCC 38327]|eukprot:KNE69141.1 hypothetical protein AMAG_13997 [Allomyces macrogynus ATCC 38327]
MITRNMRVEMARTVPGHWDAPGGLFAQVDPTEASQPDPAAFASSPSLDALPSVLRLLDQTDRADRLREWQRRKCAQHAPDEVGSACSSTSTMASPKRAPSPARSRSSCRHAARSAPSTPKRPAPSPRKPRSLETAVPAREPPEVRTSRAKAAFRAWSDRKSHDSAEQHASTEQEHRTQVALRTGRAQAATKAYVAWQHAHGGHPDGRPRLAAGPTKRYIPPVAESTAFLAPAQPTAANITFAMLFPPPPTRREQRVHAAAADLCSPPAMFAELAAYQQQHPDYLRRYPHLVARAGAAVGNVYSDPEAAVHRAKLVGAKWERLAAGKKTGQPCWTAKASPKRDQRVPSKPITPSGSRGRPSA